MAWNFDLTVSGFKFLFVDLDGYQGVVVPPDTDTYDDEYAPALQRAVDLIPHIADFMYVQEAYYYWNKPYYTDDVDRAETIYRLTQFMAQTALTKPDWMQPFLEDLRANRKPKFEKRETEKPKRKTEGYVYLIQAPSGFYKIGRAKDPQNRAKTFGVQLPFEVEFICLIQTEDMIKLETELHNHFADKRGNGEWFALAPDDVDYIKSLAGVQS